MRTFSASFWHLFLVAGSLVAGTFFFYMHQHFLFVLVTRPSYSQTEQELCSKRSIALHYWSGKTWQRETTELLWPIPEELCIIQIINQLGNVLQEEKITANKATVQAASFTPTGNCLLLSFVDKFLPADASIFEKTMIVESMLRTMKENNVTAREVLFLHNHQPLQDAHLDFEHPWPLQGFIHQTT